MAKMLSISMVSGPLVTSLLGDRLTCAASGSLSRPLLNRGRTIKHENAGRWAKCGNGSRSTGARATTKDDVSTSSTKLVELPREAADIAKKFYELVNQRDYSTIGSFFAEDCLYEDLMFAEPLKGREEIVKFFEKVMTSMGPELKFIIDDISGDDPNAVGLIWHLEWRGKTFPFSRGCSFYRCEVNSSGQREIKYARDIVEPAAKPGYIGMGTIKLVTALFERFPNLTDRF